MSELINVLQEIMQENQEALKPTDVAFGTVQTLSPLSILIDGMSQPRPEQAFILTDCVIARTAQVQGGGGGTVVINSGLNPGDKVVMMRVQKGQRYIVLSKL